MKKIFTIIGLLCSSLVFSKDLQLTKASDGAAFKRIYFGLGMGINCDYGLIGLGFKFRPVAPVMLSASAGIGTWGFKKGFNAMYLFKPNETSFGLGLGVSNAGGFSQALDIQLESTNSTKSKVLYNSVTLVNLMATQQWVFKNSGHRFFIDFGYGIPVTSNPWKIVSGPATEGGKEMLNLVKPGGLIFDFGFAFAIAEF